MNTTSHDTDAAARRYLDEAEANLADLPARDRGELLSDISDAIAELGDPSTVDYDLLVARLGSPEEFAREIRRSAGAAEATEARVRDLRPRPAIVREPASGSTGAAPAALEGAAEADTPRAVAAVAAGFRWVGSEFEPVWWFVRAFVLAGLAALLLHGLGAGFVLFVAVAILATSIVQGVRARRARSVTESASVRTARGIGVVVLGIGSLLFLLAIVGVEGGSSWSDGDPYIASYPVAADGSGGADLVGPNGPIENIYAFDAEGNRLNDVRLYDQNGVPLELGARLQDPSRRLLADASSSAVFNAFPIRYFDPGTATVANPDAGWPESPGPLVPAAPMAGTDLAVPGTAAAAPVPPAVPAPSVAPATAVERAAYAKRAAAFRAKRAAALKRAAVEAAR